MATNTVIDTAMLVATQQAANAAQSAADAAWWAVGVNGLVVVVAIGTTFLQEWRVKQRVETGNKALHQGAVDTLRHGWNAINEAYDLFTAPDFVDRKKVDTVHQSIGRSRRLIKLFIDREVDPKILVGLLHMDDHLAWTEDFLQNVLRTTRFHLTENSEFNGQLNEVAQGAKSLFNSLA